jgi:hypothetical protein
MNIPINEEYDDLPTLYWKPELHRIFIEESILPVLLLVQQKNCL